MSDVLSRVCFSRIGAVVELFVRLYKDTSLRVCIEWQIWNASLSKSAFATVEIVAKNRQVLPHLLIP